MELADVIRNCEAGLSTTLEPVFMHGETDIVTNTTYPCIRIPALTRLADGRLVAFAECRHWIGDGCEPVGWEHRRLGRVDWRDTCMKTSGDGGKTWGPLRTILNCTTQPSPVVVPPPKGQSGPGRIILQGNVCGASPTNPTSNLQAYSDDGGETWSEPQLLAPQLGSGVDGSYVGPGVGLRLSDGNPVAPGRLLFIGHRGAYVHDYVWYSDDDGQSWKVANTSFFDHMDEAQLVEVPPSVSSRLNGIPAGAILANMRNDHLNSSCDCRAVAVSTDGGETFSPPWFDSTLISPVCQATVVAGPAPSHLAPAGSDALYFANPATTQSRSNGTVRMSLTGGSQWEHDILVATAGYAYSCLVPPDGNAPLGLLWETTGNSATCSGPSCRMMMTRIPLSSF